MVFTQRFCLPRGSQQEAHDGRAGAGIVGETILGRTSCLQILRLKKPVLASSTLRKGTRVPAPTLAVSVEGKGSGREKEVLRVGVGVWASGPEAYSLLTQETASLGPGMRQVPGIKNKE